MATPLASLESNSGASLQSESRRQFDGHELFRAMLQHEAAMARTFSAFGLIRKEEAASIASTCRIELFDAEHLLRETLTLAASGRREAFPLIRRLRETVELFNPQAAAQVFRAGCVATLQRNALMLLTHRFVVQLGEHIEGLLPPLHALAPAHAARLIRARSRIDAITPLALGLHLPTMDPLACEQEPEFLAQFCKELGAPTSEAAAGPAQADDWIALGMEYGLLNMCLADLAAESTLNLDDEDRAALNSQAHRAPFVAAQWMSDLPALRASAATGARQFWDIVWPQWSALMGQTEAALKLVARGLPHGRAEASGVTRQSRFSDAPSP